MSTLSIRLPEEIEKELNIITETTERSKTYIVLQALKEYLEREAWQVAEIKQALIEADNEDFATEEKLEAVKQKWNYYANSLVK